MSISIERFIDRVRSYDARGQKEFVMPLDEAKALHADISKLMLRLDAALSQQKAAETAIQVEIRPPQFKDSSR